MKLFTNLVSLAAFLVGVYGTVSVVGGKAAVKFDDGGLAFEIRLALPAKSATETPANDAPGKLAPNWAIVTPTAEAHDGGSPRILVPDGSH
jgi:hypothetical protein